MINLLIQFGVDVVGSVVGGVILFIIWEHYHLSHLWAERQERIEERRAKKTWAGLTEEEKRGKL